jgi:deoxyribodipyrimidine photo-lyase
MNIVWFKRDLRIFDHEPLVHAISEGPVLPLYILEPELWKQPDASARHYHFLIESLNDLEDQLASIGLTLSIKVGDCLTVLSRLVKTHSISKIFSHQETWNDWTYQRDKKVISWCSENNILWAESQHHGIIRRLKSRDGWARSWHRYMTAPIIEAPLKAAGVSEPSDDLPTSQLLGLSYDVDTWKQSGGRTQAEQTLASFLDHRGEHYTREMSSPNTAFESCSRLSTYIAFGSLSVREVYQSAEDAKQLIYQSAAPGSPWRSSIRSFLSRLRWHCHFIQKLEDEPRIEFDNLHPALDGLRESHFNETFFAAWKTGNTGFPFIDACMRALISTGWINFRMRAMLVSFASNHLWLHWRKPALHLAKLFTDYEPGIHYSQIQMQSGTTGINAIRIYNPIKQGMDQDPDGEFTRRWVPELKDVDQKLIHTPWLLAEPPKTYPAPIVDEVSARKAASQRLYALRRSPEFKKKSESIVQKHASRKSTSFRSRKTLRKKEPKIMQSRLLFD